MVRWSTYIAASQRALRAFALALGLGVIAAGAPHVHAAVDVNAVVAMARSLVGSPYAYIGDDPSTGFSCIGFVHYVYGEVGVSIPYDLGLAYADEPHVSRAGLRPGDLVFFSNTVWQGLSHVALYTGNGQVIGADNYTTGVEISRLSDPYWLAHYTGATRPLGAVSPAPSEPTSTPAPATPRPLPTVTPGRVAPPRPLPHAAVSAARVGDTLAGGVAGSVYSGPGYAYPRIDHIDAHARLRVAGLQDGWANVSYDAGGVESYGWVDAGYLAHCAVSRAPTRPRRR